MNTISPNVSGNSALLERHDYALIEPGSIRNTPWHDSLPTRLIQPRWLHNDLGVLPRLLPLKDHGKPAPWLPALAQLLDDSDGDNLYLPAGCFISVLPDTKPDRLQQFLTNLLALHHPEGSAVLRYADHEVWPHLLRIMRNWLHALFGDRITTWTFRFQNEWISVPLPDGPVFHVFQANREQWARITRVSHINQALDLQKVKQARPWANLDEYQSCAEIADRALVIASEKYGLKGDKNLIAFAAHALAYGERFHEHDIIQRLLREAPPDSHGHIGYRRATNALEAAAWQAIATESPLTHPG